ncbi:hypothetical protein [Kribbella sp. NPDC000426]|uniref:hypothetical protein n=1 Tax=Kribbella sp. NPDC000426 TaxID=3154255 RepID=UPI003333DC77
MARGVASKGPTDRRIARVQRDLAKNSLPKVRAKALAWRNGLGALLAGLIGFGLIKGRTDVGELASPYAVLAGLALLAALIAGAVAALALLSAAHGALAEGSTKKLLKSRDPKSDVDQDETAVASRALKRGVIAVGFCAGLLVLAVAVTWYGPAKEPSKVSVTTPAGVVCGTVVKLEGGSLTVKTGTGDQVVPMSTATWLRVVDSCAKPG